MSDFASLMKKQRGFMQGQQRQQQQKPQSSPPKIAVQRKGNVAVPVPPPQASAPPKKNGCYVPLGERFAKATAEAFSKLQMCRSFDVLFLFLWVGMIIIPPCVYSVREHDAKFFGDSPASAMFLLLLTSATPISIVSLRVWTSMRISRTLRVDKVANAPKTMRQLAYTTHDPALAWWFWCGYVLAPLVAVLNIMLVLAWYFLVGVAVVLSVFIVVLSLFYAFSSIKCTQWFYRVGIQSNYAFNIAISNASRKEWALYCAQETRNQFLRQNTDDYETGGGDHTV